MMYIDYFIAGDPLIHEDMHENQKLEWEFCDKPGSARLTEKGDLSDDGRGDALPGQYGQQEDSSGLNKDLAWPALI